MTVETYGEWKQRRGITDKDEHRFLKRQRAWRLALELEMERRESRGLKRLWLGTRQRWLYATRLRGVKGAGMKGAL